MPIIPNKPHYPPLRRFACGCGFIIQGSKASIIRAEKRHLTQCLDELGRSRVLYHLPSRL